MTPLDKFRKKYYTNPLIQNKLIEEMKNKEVVFMHKTEHWKCIRGLVIKNVDALNWLFNFYDFFNEKFNFKNNYNIYVSQANYKFIPRFDFNLKFRSKETSKFFREDAASYIKDFEYFFDFDFVRGKFEELKKEIYNFSIYMDSTFVYYKMFPSGSGFQFVSTGSTLEENPIEIKNDILKIGEMQNLKFLCTGGLGSLSKIRKCPYSLVSDIPLYPFKSKEEILNFQYKDIKHKITDVEKKLEWR